jgi:CheY-like chemotaxis protein
LLNLALNARDAMPRGGELTISTSNIHVDIAMLIAHPDLTEGDYVRIAISDTGTGMSAETKARIFEPFFTTKQPGRGTGLGLSAVFGFLRQSHGAVTVYSEIGHGTTFHLYLPRATSGSPGAEPSQDDVPRPHDAHGGTALIVDDNPLFRAALTHQLEALGYQVRDADSARAALDVLAAETVHVVISDIVMAGNMDGVDLAREITATRPGLPIILMSGFAETRINESGDEFLASLPFLEKPFRSDQLVRALQTAAERQ